MIAANNAWIMAYDNLSSIAGWLSDAMCRLNCGGGFATRELYTNDEETIFDAARPIMLTSIEDVATRSDLLDRCLIVSLQPLDDNERKSEKELWEQFEPARPRILGALLDCISVALCNLPTTQLDRQSRMLDFLQWVVAAEPALGWPAGHFLDAYEANRGEANALAMEASPIAKELLAFLDSLGSDKWSGTAGELLNLLNHRRLLPPGKNWPQSSRGLSGQLKRLAPNLKAAGWDWSVDRDSTPQRNRIITLQKVATAIVQTVQSVRKLTAESLFSDDADGLDGRSTLASVAAPSQTGTPEPTLAAAV
jgi:hypothetical protein